MRVPLTVFERVNKKSSRGVLSIVAKFRRYICNMLLVVYIRYRDQGTKNTLYHIKIFLLLSSQPRKLTNYIDMPYLNVKLPLCRRKCISIIKPKFACFLEVEGTVNLQVKYRINENSRT